MKTSAELVGVIITVVWLGTVCIPPTVNYQYLATGSTLTAFVPFQLPAPQSGTLSQISFRP